MTTTQAIIGYGSTIEVETSAGSGVYTKLGEVTSITPPNEKVDQIDVTHMESPNRTREFIQGLIDPGEMSLDINYVPGGSTDDFIIAWRLAGESRSVKLTFPSSAAVWTFPAFILGFTPTMGVAEALKAALSLKVAGAVTRT